MNHRPALTLGDRRRISSVLAIADRKPMPEIRGLVPARKPRGTGFLVGFMFGFTSCAIVLAIALSVI